MRTHARWLFAWKADEGGYVVNWSGSAERPMRPYIFCGAPHAFLHILRSVPCVLAYSQFIFGELIDHHGVFDGGGGGIVHVLGVFP